MSSWQAGVWRSIFFAVSFAYLKKRKRIIGIINIFVIGSVLGQLCFILPFTKSYILFISIYKRLVTQLLCSTFLQPQNGVYHLPALSLTLSPFYVGGCVMCVVCLGQPRTFKHLSILSYGVLTFCIAFSLMKYKTKQDF